MEFKNVCRSLILIVACLFVTYVFTAKAVTLLTVPQGGTGAGTFTAGGILQGDGTGAIQSNIMSGDGTLSASGVLTVSADAVETITVEGKATETIAMGKAVYISGAVGNNVQFSLADNTVDGKNYVAGVAIELKTAGQTIRVRHVGQLDNFDTSAWADGDNLYLSTAGSLINTVPTSGTTLHVAYVEYSHASLGDILLHICGEKNIGAPASTDLFLRMGDNAGTNKLSYRDYANNEIANIDSDGNMYFGGSVGIGIATPAQLFHMQGNGTAAQGWARFGLSSTEYTEIGHRGSNSAINAVGDGNLDFRHDSVTKMSLTDAGVLTATTFTGALSGNATTATALAANGANCGAGNYPLGVDASGAVESCTADANTTYVSSDFVHDDLTGFVANEHLDWTGDLGATNIHAGNYTDTDTTYTAGRSLTLSGVDILADSELYKTKAKIAFEDPVATDDFFFEELATATTFTSIYCKTLVGTVTLDVSIAGSDINGVDIVCNTTGVLDSSLGGDTAGAVGEELALVITSVASDPTYLFLQVNGTYDD